MLEWTSKQSKRQKYDKSGELSQIMLDVIGCLTGKISNQNLAKSVAWITLASGGWVDWIGQVDRFFEKLIFFSPGYISLLEQVEASFWLARERQIWALTSFTAAIEQFMLLR